MVTTIVGLDAFGANCHIIGNDKNEAVIIDAPSNADFILKRISELGLTLKKILITHGHCDHIEAIPELVRRTGAEVYIHENDKDKLVDNSKNLFGFFGLGDFEGFSDAKTVKDGDEIVFSNLKFTVIHTPGHSSGCVCYACGDNLFTGDTLFAGSIGRTDFPDSKFTDMQKSLKKLASLEKNYNIYSGHGEKSTLYYEKDTNMYLVGDYYDTAF